MLLSLTDCGGGGGSTKDEVEHTGDAEYDQCEADQTDKNFDGSEPSYNYDTVSASASTNPGPGPELQATGGEHVASTQEEINGGYRLPTYNPGQPGPGWLVLIGDSSDNNTAFCSGVKIERDVVLTAAHCLYFDKKRKARADPSAVTYWYRYTNSVLEPRNEGYGIIYPRYINDRMSDNKGPGAVYDFAVIVTNEGGKSNHGDGLPFGAFNGFDPVSGEECTSKAVTSCGWGLHQSNIPGYPPTKGETDDVGFDIAKCFNQPADKCTFSKNGVGTYNTLAVSRGDSGGPSLYEGKDNIEYVVGIHSNGGNNGKNGSDFRRTGDFYDGVITSKVMDWICQDKEVPTNYTGPNKVADRTLKYTSSCKDRTNPQCYTVHK